MEQTKWIDRKFNFNFPAGLFPNIIERLRGTPIRLEKMIEGINRETLTKKLGSAWSIQEHAGHLLDVDALHEKRINQFIANMDILMPADMSNKKTNLADYNSKDINDILMQFSAARNSLTTNAERLDDILIIRTAIHPRLNTEMRLVDMLYFAAEHDDHHLAFIRNLIKNFQYNAGRI